MNTTDQRIDQLLQALGATAAPAGLEQRVNARVAQRAAEIARHKSFSLRRTLSHTADSTVSKTSLWFDAFAATAVLVLITAAVVTRVHKGNPEFVHEQAPTSGSRLLSAPLATSHIVRQPVYRSRSEQTDAAAGSPPTPAEASDPDAIALAETFAPSHAAPPLPLTSQEALLLHSTRLGQPIEVAELGTLHESALDAIAAEHERASIREYVHGLLGPLATAQSLTPSSSPQPDDIAPVADIEPPSSK
jgi:hypothetical protein